MTGAPKLRTWRSSMPSSPARAASTPGRSDICRRGAADLSIAIRTALLYPGRLSVGAGGAIVAL